MQDPVPQDLCSLARAECREQEVFGGLAVGGTPWGPDPGNNLRHWGEAPFALNRYEAGRMHWQRFSAYGP